MEAKNGTTASKMQRLDGLDELNIDSTQCPQLPVLPVDVWCIVLNQLDFYSIRYGAVSKSFNEMVYNCVIEMTGIFKFLLKTRPFNVSNILVDDFIQRLLLLKYLISLVMNIVVSQIWELKSLKIFPLLPLIVIFQIMDLNI
jgi:hypothetical protein